MAATRNWIERSLRFDADEEPGRDVYLDASDFERVLRLCDESLRSTGYAVVADGLLADTLRRIAAFGMTLTRLDVRQEAARHTEALSAVTSALGLGVYADWDEAARIEFLTRELTSGDRALPSNLVMTPHVQDIFETFRMIARIPSGSLGAYVITMTSRTSDVLAVEFLQA